ncbi:MAG: PilZ domain-containing protein [Desulfobacteraceae bacterium]|jgi:Tfp pilus assembly protein PilZ
MPGLNEKIADSAKSARLIELILKMTDEEQESLLIQLEEKLSVRKRKHDRKSYFSVVDYNALEAAHTGFIENISAGGVFIGTSKSFPIGEEISMAFPLPVSQEHVRMEGEVVRANAEGIGVKFKAVDHEQEGMIRRLVEMMQ